MSADIAELKNAGNQEFKQGRYLVAAAAYSRAIKGAEASSEKDEHVLAVLYSNRAASLHRLNKYNKALADAQQATLLRPTWEKGHFREGQALEALGRLAEAQEKYLKAKECNPAASEISAHVVQVGKLLRREKQLGKQPGDKGGESQGSEKIGSKGVQSEGEKANQSEGGGVSKGGQQGKSAAHVGYGNVGQKGDQQTGGKGANGGVNAREEGKDNKQGVEQVANGHAAAKG